jgi:hypothetical protein
MGLMDFHCNAFLGTNCFSLTEIRVWGNRSDIH